MTQQRVWSNMHYRTYALNETGSTWLAEFGFNLYFQLVVQLRWVGSKYGAEPGSILHVEPVVLFA